ncbi:hypothetical protein MKEN_00252900 [Mycena kentingensis (nom. inval.)]|nr:hypothetical protein MKEN_00252900 [Mycena kentingensis (nom. inval.)]
MLAARLRCFAASRPTFTNVLFRQYAAAATAQATTPVTPEDDQDDTKVPFSSLAGKVSPETLKAITVKPFQLVNMSPVQSKVLPLLPDLAKPYKEGSTELRDLLVRAKTGTGKTLGFLVPAIEARVLALKDTTKGPHFQHASVGTLVVSPTRELATQIATEALKLTQHHKGFEVRLLTGGNSKRMQMREWMKGRKDIVVGTPGRLRDLLASEPSVQEALATTQTLVLDEADTLLEMGFREDIEEIKRCLTPTPERQTFLFSATVSKEIQQVARSILSPHHEYINCVSDEAPPVHAHVPQHYTLLPSPADQLPHIIRLIMHDQLINPTNSKIIIFLPTTKMTQLFSTLISTLQMSLPAQRQTRIFEIHSKRTQEKRTMVSESFRRTTSPSVLITSDVSARGVDYPGVTRVIQVGIPSGREHYIHRVGRTGRAGTAGRGDLVLFNWEQGFLTWQLTDVPLRELPTSVLNDELADLSKQHDADPSAFSSGSSKRSAFPTNAVLPLVENLNEEVRALLGRLDGGALRETFLSLLGYYIAKSPELRIPRTTIVQACQEWTTKGWGMDEPPFVSVDFLQRLGVDDGRTKHFGKRRVSSEWRRSGSGDGHSAIWQQRGNVRNRIERDENPTFLHRGPGRATPEEEAEAKEYRTPRYESPRPQRGAGYVRDRPSFANNNNGYREGGYGGGNFGRDSNYSPRNSGSAYGRRDSGGSGFGMQRDNGRDSGYGGGGYRRQDGGYDRRDRGSGDGGYGRR